MERNNKKELKVVLSSELYDELRFVFRPEVLENVIYKPEILTDTKWQCCCGSENELEVCPICGMEKNTVFSKVNAGYLARHRKARIARKRKAMQDQQAMMAAQIIKKNKKQKKDNNQKMGTVIGIVFLCLAVIVSIVILFSNNNKPKDPATDTTINTEQTLAPEATDANPPEDSETNAPDSTDSPETTETAPPETTVPEITAPTEPVNIPSSPTTGNVATIAEGNWPTGASGNTSAGGLVYSGDTYDYIAKDGIKVLDKAGNEVDTLTSNKALGITGSGNYLFYIDEGYTVHRFDTATKTDTAFTLKAKTICVYFDELYYVPYEEKGLFASDFSGNKTKVLTLLEVYALNNTADKLYFSTEESLCVITSKDGNVTTFCADGAKATSIIEITNCVFYTGTDGKLKFYNPAKPSGYSIEYPKYNVAITYVCEYENRVYIRTYDQASGAVHWYSTKWTPGTKLFAPSAFVSTGVTTNSLYVSNNAIFDGDLNRKAVS